MVCDQSWKLHLHAPRRGLTSRSLAPQALATGLTGGFLLALGIDLLVNPNTGMSLGLRFLIDQNSSDTLQLESYTPPTTTRVIIALCMALG